MIKHPLPMFVCVPIIRFGILLLHKFYEINFLFLCTRFVVLMIIPEHITELAQFQEIPAILKVNRNFHYACISMPCHFILMLNHIYGTADVDCE